MDPARSGMMAKAPGTRKIKREKKTKMHHHRAAAGIGADARCTGSLGLFFFFSPSSVSWLPSFSVRLAEPDDREPIGPRALEVADRPAVRGCPHAAVPPAGKGRGERGLQPRAPQQGGAAGEGQHGAVARCPYTFACFFLKKNSCKLHI
jgi:hypothetical protein